MLRTRQNPVSITSFLKILTPEINNYSLASVFTKIFYNFVFDEITL